MYKSTIKRVFSYVKPFKLTFFASLLFALASVAFTLYIPMLIGEAVDSLTADGGVDFTSLNHALLKIVISAALGFISQYFAARCNNALSYKVSYRLRSDAFNHLHELPLSFFQRSSGGEVISRLTQDVDQISDGLLLGFNQLFSGLMTIIGTLYFLFSVNYLIALVVVLLTPLSLFAASFIARHTHRMFRLQSERREKQTSFINEMIDGDVEIKCGGCEKEVLASFDVLNEEWAESALKATFFSSITNPSTRFVNSVVYAIVALSGALSALAGRISIGALTSALSYANQYTKPFNEISGVVTELQNALVSAMRVFALIEEKGESEDSSQILDVSSGEVIFNKISFSYEKDKPLIKDFSLSVKGGEHIAIVGPTGAGKTTLINLLMRFYDVDEGCIRIDGSSIDSVSRKSLRSAFGMVLQDTYILHASVWENIDLGRGFSKDAIREAARKAHADTFINRLEDGYDTLLSDEGAALSAGERQLLCIARIMLSLPSILLLDEATSSIDTRTEALIQSSFMALMDKRTSFVVAHRLSTIERSDVILVLRDGNIVEMGNHKELLAKRGFYKELFDSQFC